MHLRAVGLANASIGIAVGDTGTILRTTDGGATWDARTSGTTRNLRGLALVNANTGFAVGWYGVILRTTDGGATWDSLYLGANNDGYGVSFADVRTGNVVAGNYVFRTTDGGNTWEFQPLPCNTTIYCIATPDANTATVVGYNGTILHTTTGGATWVQEVHAIPEPFELKQNYPNPFNPTTTIRYTIGGVVALSGSEGPATMVKLAVYDILGRVVAVLVDERKQPGEYAATWDARGIASGVYFNRLMIGGACETKKMLLLR
jgi:photosystem II stability/assembly factor-like uncharacterized protein